MNAIDVLIKESLEDFVEDIFASSWWGKEREYDLEWLCAFSANRPAFTGYALCLNLKRPDFRLRCIRVQNEKKDLNWLRL